MLTAGGRQQRPRVRRSLLDATVLRQDVQELFVLGIPCLGSHARSSCQWVPVGSRRCRRIVLPLLSSWLG